MAEKKPTFDLKRSEDQFHFNLVAPNGETIATSERYTTKAAGRARYRRGEAVRVTGPDRRSDVMQRL